MNVGIYFGDYYPDSGGAYTFVTDLLDAFTKVAAASEHNFVLLCNPAAAQAVAPRDKPPNVVVVPVPRISWLRRWPAGLKYYSPLFRRLWRRRGTVERMARHHRVELLWYVGTGRYECPDIPYVATQWDVEHRIKPYFPEVSADGLWDDRDQYYGYFLRRASYCVTGTVVGKRQIERMFQLAEARVRVVPMPTPMFALDAGPSSVDLRKRFGIGGEYVFYPAQFWPHKNHGNLILALKWLKMEKGLEISLALSGSDKGHLSFVKNFAKHQGLEKQVVFLGFVSRNELTALYQQSIALTFVSYCGPDNIPPLEAFALGAPVIASAVEGASEQFEGAAVLVNPSDPAEIGRAVWDIYSDRQFRANHVKAGLRRARAWTSADYLEKMLQLFDEFAAIRRNW